MWTKHHKCNRSRKLSPEGGDANSRRVGPASRRRRERQPTSRMANPRDPVCAAGQRRPCHALRSRRRSRLKRPPLERARREAAEKAERRRLHMEKIERMKDAFRRGSPEQFVFDPADGPVPRLSATTSMGRRTSPEWRMMGLRGRMGPMAHRSHTVP